MAARQFAGGAVATALSAGITAGATSATLVGGTGTSYPAENFVVVIDRGRPTEEKVLVATRSTDSLLTLTRGYDGTTAQAHSSGATVEHTLDTVVLAKHEAMVEAGTTAGDMLYATAAGVYTRIPKGSAGQVLVSNGSVPSWGTVTAVGLGTDSVGADEIATDGVAAAEIAAGAVGSSELATGAVTEAKLGMANVKLRRASGQSIADEAAATIAWDTEDADASGLHSAGTITPSAGLWIVGCRLAVNEVSANFTTSCFLQLNALSALAQVTLFPGSVVGGLGCVMYFNGTDTLRVYVSHNDQAGSAAVSVTGHLWATRLMS